MKRYEEVLRVGIIVLSFILFFYVTIHLIRTNSKFFRARCILEILRDLASTRPLFRFSSLCNSHAKCNLFKYSFHSLQQQKEPLGLALSRNFFSPVRMIETATPRYGTETLISLYCCF